MEIPSLLRSDIKNHLFPKNSFKAFLVFILGWMVTIFLILLLSGCGKTSIPEANSTITVLQVVMDNNYPPYVFQDGSGKLQGILIDQWKLWEKKTGVKVEITALDWGQALNRMKAGDFDVIDTIFYTDERADSFDFTKPYAQIDVSILVT